MNRLPLSRKGMNPETADDYGCDYPGCENRATGYVFMGPQFCDDHAGSYRHEPHSAPMPGKPKEGQVT